MLVGMTWPIPREHLASGAGYAEGLKAGETFVINFLFSRTSQGTSDISREEMLIAWESAEGDRSCSGSGWIYCY